MILDAPSFQLVLTPESALGVVQKEVQHRGWKKMEVEEIRLIYTPFYMFSFDVRAEGSAPITGKAALNAYNGEISDFIPQLMERPLKKTKSGEEGAEVEDTAISPSEAKEAAKEKIAAQTGLKSEMVSVSAFTKIYIPFFRVWMEVGRSPMKIDVDALMGYPLGIENAPERQKTWGEATGETLSKLKSPSGWVELTGRAVGAVMGGGGHGGGDAHGDSHGVSGDPGKTRRWIILVAFILVAAYFIFLQPTSNIKCNGKITQTIKGCVLEGSCEVTAKKAEDMPGKIIQVYVKYKGQEQYDLMENVGFYDQAIETYKIPSDKDAWTPI
ncbi:MAG: hypothetical protein ABIG96_03040, partial [Candidatus Micrarchaeota archaeon]